MANVIRIGVENPDELLNASMYGTGAVVQVQTASDQAFTSPSDVTTVAIVTGVTAYTAYHQAGTSSSWYRTRYENAGETVTSDWSDAFQATPATLASLYDLKSKLGYDQTITTHDEDFLEYLRRVTDFIHGETRRHFLPDDAATYRFDGWDAVANGRCLVVRRGIRSVTTLKTAPNTNGTLAAVSSTDFFLRPSSAELRSGEPATQVWLSDLTGSIFSLGFSNIEIVGNFGWSAPPGDIEDVCLNTAARMWLSRQAGQADIVGSGESGNPIVSRYLGVQDRETINRYRGVIV